MIIKLPIQYPNVRCYQHHCVMQSIILSNASDLQIMQWHSQHYLQLKVNHMKHKEAGLDFFPPAQRTPLINTQNITREELLSSRSISQFIAEKLSKGFYVYGMINTKYIIVYGNRDLLHNVFIYGFDDTRMLFFAADYFNQFFGYSEISFYEINMAFALVEPEKYHLLWTSLLKYTDKQICFRKDKIYKLMEDYLFSRDTTMAEPMFNTYAKSDFIFGSQIYDRLLYDLNQLIKEPDIYVDQRAYSVLVEHKRMLILIFNYILPHKKGELITEDLEIILNITIVTRNLLIKYGICRDIRILNKCLNNIQRIQEKEKTVFLNAITCI